MNPSIHTINELVRSAMIPCFVIAGIFAFVAAVDKERPRPRWAKQSLVCFGLVAIGTGVLNYLWAAGKFPIQGHPWKWEPFVAMCKGLSVGMLAILIASGQFWAKKGQPQKPRGGGNA